MSHVDAYVQRWVAGTNGNLYLPLIDRLTRYPIPRWPGQAAKPGADRLLDVGCGWGRWMLSAARAGYRPVGIDVQPEALQAARRVLEEHDIHGDFVVADLAALPFRAGCFDCVFSYSVVQHVSKGRAAAFVGEAARILKRNGTALIELPLSHGLSNFRHLLKRRPVDDAASWCVRYYRWSELKALFGGRFGEVRISSDCFCGIGVRGEDIDMMPWRYKPIVAISEALKWVARIFPGFARLSDSVFIHSERGSGNE